MIGKGVLFGAMMGLAGAALAQGMTPKAAADARILRYREVGAAFKTINDQVKTGTLIKMMARPAARTILAAARDQYQWFPAGSGVESGAKTKALPAVWSDAAGFKKAQLAFQQQADLMAKAVEASQLPAMQAQAKALGQTCAACHKGYRAE